MRLVAEYFASPFSGAHLAVWGLCVYLIALHVRAFTQIDRLRGRKPDAASEYLDRATVYLGYYEYFAAAFVLIGLLGTIYGFYEALARTGAEFDPSAIRPALVTSGFGILWAVLLGGVVELWLRRRTAHYRFQLSLLPQRGLEQALEALSTRYESGLGEVARSIGALHKELESVFSSGARSFADAGKELAAAARDLRSSVDEAAGSFRESMERAAETSRRLDDALHSAAGLPGKVGDELQAAAAAIVARMDEAIASVATGLAATAELPRQLAGEMAATHAAYVERLNAIGESAGAAAAASVTAAAGLASSVCAELRQTSAEIMAAIGGTAASVSDSLSATTALPRKLAEEMASTHAAYRAELDAAAGTIKAAAAAAAAVLNAAADIPERIAERMEAANQGYLERMDAAGERIGKVSENVQQSTREFLETYTQAAATLTGDYKNKAELMADMLRELMGEIRRANEDFTAEAHSLTNTFRGLLQEEHQQNLAALEQNVSRVWLQAVEALDRAAVALGGEAGRLEKQREELYRAETARIQERFSALLQDFDKLAEGWRQAAGEALDARAGELKDESARLAARVDSLARSMEAAAAGLAGATGDWRSDLSGLSADISSLRDAIARFKPAVAPAPAAGPELALALNSIQEAVNDVRDNGLLLRRRARVRRWWPFKKA